MYKITQTNMQFNPKDRLKVSPELNADSILRLTGISDFDKAMVTIRNLYKYYLIDHQIKGFISGVDTFDENSNTFIYQTKGVFDDIKVCIEKE